jgi:hypothetical protein
MAVLVLPLVGRSASALSSPLPTRPADAKSEEYDSTSRRYRRLGKALAYAVQDVDPALALTLLQATKRLVEAPPVDYPVAAAMAAGGVRSGVPGRLMRLRDKTHLDSTLNTLLAVRGSVRGWWGDGWYKGGERFKLYQHPRPLHHHHRAATHPPSYRAQEELLAHSRRMHSQPAGDATGLSSSVLAQVPHLGHLLSCQDRMGRTPLHIAGAYVRSTQV